jgi:hypothetical protein
MSYDPELFNADPYYDDYSESKKFLRVMFKPGYALQAREVTQLQTILQNQIERFGNHIFENGSVVLDGQVTENILRFGRITGLSGTSTVTDLVGAVVGNTGSAQARIVHAESGLSSSTVDGYNVVFFEYLGGGTGFTAGMFVSGTAGTTPVSFSLSGNATVGAIGEATVVSVDSGVRYVDGYFVLHDAQMIGACSTTGASGSQYRVYSNPTTRIGFVSNKSFVNANEDTTLNDPAFGYYNYAAPGADRFKIDLELAQYAFNPTDVTTTSNFAREDFIEFIRIVDGETVKKELYPSYAAIEDTLARRTYDESGNYTVDPFDLTLTYRGVTGGATGNTLTAELGPGKAYIFGYEFETQGVTPITLARPRTTKSYTNQTMIGSIGPSILVSPGLTTASLTGFNLTNQSLMYLSDGASGATFNNIGTARIRSLKYESTNLYRAYLYDISLTGSYTMANATRLFVAENARQGGATSQPAFNIQWQGATGTLSNVVDTGMLFLVPKGDRVEGIDGVNYATSNFVALNLNGSGFGSYTTPSANIDLPSVGSQIVNPTAEFFVLSVSGAAVGFTGQIENANKFSLTASSAANQKVYVFFTTDIDSASVRRNKTRVTETFGLTSASLQTDPKTGKRFFYFVGTTGPYNDVVSVISITGSLSGSSQQISNLLTLDNGQRDDYYDWARLLVSDNTTVSSTAGPNTITGPYQVTVTRYTHSGDLGPFTVDSYSGEYKDIPSYTSPTTGRTYRLSDVLDFRPTKTTDGSLTGQYLVPSETAANDRKIDYTHYLPRTDKIVLNRDRSFKVLTGIPAIDPVAPADDADAMTLYSITMNGYTVDNTDVQIKRVENKRYTMQDIAELENRIDNVEYYTNLSLIEQQAKSSPFLDSDGIEMPKKGILADGFRGHSIGDVLDPMYAASVDFENGEMRPAFRNRVFRMNSSSNAVNVTGSADGIFTLDYTTTPLINQPLATTSIVVNPSGVFNYLGFVRSTPSSDFWMDDINSPVVRINTEGENDSWAYGIASGTGPGEAKGFGSQWNDWESNWSGIERNDYVAPDITVANRSIFVTSSGSRLSAPASRSSILPDSIVDTVGSLQVRKDIQPYARSIAVTLNAKNLRPNTYMNLFMDGVSLSTGATSDASGSLSLTFTIPAASYATGKRQIRLTDSATNTLSETTTAADYILPIEGTWGTFKDGVVSTRSVQTRRETVRSERIVTNVFGKNLQRSESTKLLGYTDPLSQSFYVDPTIYPSGIFLKKVTLYFKSKDSNNNSPITLTLRPVINGYPHPSKFVPLSDVTILSSAITTSTIAATGTDFEFTSPIYLPPGEHAFSLTTPSNNFEIYSSEIGQSVIKQTTTEATRRATKQPYARSLFKNQTSTGLQKSEVQDVKFLLHLCSFKNTQPTRTVTIQNAASTYYGASFDIDVIRYNFPVVTPAGTSMIVKETGIVADSQSTINLNQNIISVKSTPPNVSGSSQFTQLDITLDSDDEFVSPVFDIDRASAYFVENKINNVVLNTAGETGATNLSVAAANRTASRFITKRVVLEPGMEATNLRVEMLGSYPAETNFKVYARMSPENGTGLPFDLREYVEMTASSSYANTAVDSFQEMAYTLTNQTPFRVFAVKIVMTSSDGRIVPRFKNLRITAA